MKINISKTELNAMPHIGWNKLCEFALKNQENEAQYTPMQKNAAFTVYEPLRQLREYQLGEISTVRETLQGLVVYADGRKAFGVDRCVSYTSIFYAQLHAAGKMEATQCRNEFVVFQMIR